MTDDDMLVMEDEDHLQSHHITTNMKPNKANLEGQENSSTGNNQNQSTAAVPANVIQNSQNKAQKSGPNGKIYNTHDGRQKQASKHQSSSKGHQNIIKTHGNYNAQSQQQ